MSKIKIKKIAMCALFTAIITACAWISIPIPFGVNLTFSLFGVCVAAMCLGFKGGLASVITYILLGVLGVPVFSQFMGGFGVLFGASGGFIFGFLLSATICGIAKNVKNKILKYLLLLVAVLGCHTVGIVQFSVVTGNGLWAVFLYASLPFLVKDIILVYLAQFIAKKIKI